jgi:hypothetical protein
VSGAKPALASGKYSSFSKKIVSFVRCTGRLIETHQHARRLRGHTGRIDAEITSRDDLRRVLIAGDTHGNTAWVDALARTAAEQGCPIIIQVGDFGYFPDHQEGPRFLTAVGTACALNGVEL